MIFEPDDFVTWDIPFAVPDRWQAIRRMYRWFQKRVEAGRANWMDHSDVYDIGDWAGLMTPIEAAAWCDIRELGVPLWPQLPVGRYFVDFGNPVRRVAVECDGAAWHDADKDAKRDAVLNDAGWRVIRIAGRDCYGEEGREAIRRAGAYVRLWGSE